MMANRSRRYLTGANGGVPLPLSVEDITNVTYAHPSPISRRELDYCIFSLDSEFLESIGDDKPKPQENVESVWSSVVADINN